MFKQKLNYYTKLIENELDKAVELPNCREKVVFEAVRYSLLANGKRIRPILCLEFNNIFSSNENASMPFAVAVEMIHAYSLIHDDLPCMDNDDFRRNKPTNHKVFGEANALLAGDALLTMAFSQACKADKEIIPYENIIKAIGILADCSGAYGMIGGQVIDLANENKEIDFDTLADMHYKKTSKLIEAACLMGAVCAGCDYEILNNIKEYAFNLGMAFQVIDDILDVEGDPNLLGKPIKSDEKSHKSTFVTLFGIDEAKERAIKYTEKAQKIIKILPNNEFLTCFTDYLLERNF